jgi:hypothetical protein
VHRTRRAVPAGTHRTLVGDRPLLPMNWRPGQNGISRCSTRWRGHRRVRGHFLTPATRRPDDSVRPPRELPTQASRNGNRVTANGCVYATGDDNRLLFDGTYSYAYDAEGNRTARFIDVDEDGILDAGDTDIAQYTWDARNRLTEVRDYATYGGDPTQVVDYGL